MRDTKIGTPRLSAVLVSDRYSTIAAVVDAFAAQTAPSDIEIVLVLPAHAVSEVDRSKLEWFGAFQIVALPSVLPMPPARAAGVRAATAPIIFIGETHSFPHPGFIEAIITAHEGPWDVVVPGLHNANPDMPGSWGSFMLDYGYWMSGLPAAEIASGPTWNASYKREILLELGSALDSALSSGDELPMTLRARNRRFYFEPAAGVSHVNLESRKWVDERYLSGFVVGANRARRWSLPRRIAYFLGSPLIPVVLLYRTVPSMRHLYRSRTLPQGSALAIVTGTIIRTVGEAVGYLRGLSAPVEARMEEYELNKMQYVKRVAPLDQPHG